MFSASQYRAMYKRFLGPLSRPVSLLLQSGADYIAYETKAHVTKYTEQDLVAGGTAQLGDLKLIVLAEDLEFFGITKMTKKDRVNIDGFTYSIIHWDEYTRTVGENAVAVEMTIRGGGLATVASVAVYRITGDSDNRITGDGDRRVIREAV